MTVGKHLVVPGGAKQSPPSKRLPKESGTGVKRHLPVGDEEQTGLGCAGRGEPPNRKAHHMGAIKTVLGQFLWPELRSPFLFFRANNLTQLQKSQRAY